MKDASLRIYNVCSKVTASQKKRYTELAQKEGLSLSEWISSTIEISIENKFKNRVLKDDLKNLNNIVKRENIINYNKGGEVKKMFIDNTIDKSLKINKNQLIFDNEIKQYRSTANTFNTIGIMAFLGAIVFKLK